MNNEFIEARFIDDGHLNVSVISKNSDGELVEDIIQADPTQNQYKELLKHTTEKAIFDRTAEWKLETKRALDTVIKPIIDTEVEKRVEEQLESKYGSILDELKIKRKEVKSLAYSLETQAEDRKHMWSKNVSEKPDTPESLLKQILDNNTNEEFLFKIKLEIFNLDKVKKSKSKKLKTDIRKAKSIIEILNLIK